MNKKKGKPKPPWFLYIIRCAGGNFYTGVTTDVDRRLKEHKMGGSKGAKYLRGRTPLKLVYRRKIGDRGLALKMENRIKKLSKIKKEAIVNEYFQLLFSPLRHQDTKKN